MFGLSLRPEGKSRHWSNQTRDMSRSLGRYTEEAAQRQPLVGCQQCKDPDKYPRRGIWRRLRGTSINAHMRAGKKLNHITQRTWKILKKFSKPNPRLEQEDKLGQEARNDGGGQKVRGLESC